MGCHFFWLSHGWKPHRELAWGRSRNCSEGNSLGRPSQRSHCSSNAGLCWMTKHQPRLAPSQCWGFGLVSNPQCPGCWGGQILGATQRSGDTGCPVLTQGKVDIVSSRQLWQRSWRKPRTGSAKPCGTLVQHPWGLNRWQYFYYLIFSPDMDNCEHIWCNTANI